MRMNYLRLWGLTVATFFLMGFAALSAENPGEIRVSVRVGGDENLTGAATSYLSRELRSLGDIEITDDEPTYAIDVVIMPLKSQSGVQTGYAMSVVVSSPVYQSIRETVGPSVDQKSLALLDGAYKSAVLIDDHLIQSGSPDDLQSMCKSIVAGIDGNEFETTRKLLQQFKDMQQKNQQTPAK